MPSPSSRLRQVLITNRQLARPALPLAVQRALAAGVTSVILREKDLTTRALFALAAEIQAVCQENDVPLIIHDRADVALALDAAGVHLGWQSLPIGAVRRLVGAGRLVGKSTHTLKEATQAQAEGADYITFGPIHRTPTKEGLLKPRGEAALAEVTRAVHIPVLALGGMQPGNMQAAFDAGAAGIAGIRCFLKE